MTNEQLNKALKISEALNKLFECNSRYSKILADEFIFKNILGFTDEELKLNKELLIKEEANKLLLRKRAEAEMRKIDAENDFNVNNNKTVERINGYLKRGI